MKDQLGRSIKLTHIPERIVSLVPSQTELLVDLGLGEKLVGITKFCIHPKGLKEITAVVGGTKTVHFDKIKDLRPDLIICNKEENTHAMVNGLEQIAPVYVSDISTLEDSLEMIWQLGSLLGVSEEATKLISTITSEKIEFEAFIKAREYKKVAYLIWKDPFMTAGKGTFIDSMLELNHFENIISEERYPNVSVAQLQTADMVLLSTEPYPFEEKHAIQLQKQLNVPVILVDGEYFSWYGSRLASAFDYFKTLHF